MDKDEGKCSFPVGMRVLAVDADRQYLQVLKEMLIQCQYQVTTTTQPIKALEMLRENRNKFELVIVSDVNMADMDGFQLLQLVRRELDLPVIMYSDHGDTNMVKKGVLHGACQYLVKPFRTEEMQNIWQHVLRRQINLKACCFMAGEGASLGIVASSSEEESIDHPSSSTQKKPRFDWTLERHQIFVAAVNQLGLEKAVPKKILALMKDSVDGLTREIVASHLQKHRLNVRRTAEKQAANMVAAWGGSRPCQQHTAYGSGGFSSSTGILPRMNSSPSALNMGGRSSSCSSLGLPQKHVVGSNHPYMFCAADQSSHGIPTSTNKLNHHQFQQSNNAATSPIDHPNNNSSGFAVVPSVCTNSPTAFNNVGATPLATHYPDKFYSDARLMDQSSDFGSSDDMLLYLINSSEPTKWDAIDGIWRN